MIAPMNDAKKDAVAAKIDRLEQTYRVGDYKQVRMLLKHLRSAELASADSLRVEKVARAVAIDRGALVAFAITFLMLALLVLKYGF